MFMTMNHTALSYNLIHAMMNIVSQQHMLNMYVEHIQVVGRSLVTLQRRSKNRLHYVEIHMYKYFFGGCLLEVEGCC